jgi:deoxyguanosinetriphosphate triphosphohydrolase, putative
MQWSELLCEKKVKESREIATSNDNRSIFEKDYHRIISSSSFRRLQDKAQVFPLEKYDFVRTRLTHSMEVASVARSLGNGLIPFIGGKDDCDNVKYIPIILECSGLLHDMGNPPFGHFGEDAIRDWFKDNLKKIYYDKKEERFSFEKNVECINLLDILSEQQAADFNNFEGNAQSLRIVTKLAYVIDENGMNLSYPLLNTIIKYPVPSHKINENILTAHKMGYFTSESNIFEEIVSSTMTKVGSEIRRHPLTFLLEAADDITYRTDDLEDAFNKKKLRVSDILDILEQNKYKGDVFCQSIKNRIEDYRTKARELCYKNIEMYIIQRLKIYIQGNLINYVQDTFKRYYDDIMEGTLNNELLELSEGRLAVEMLKECAKKYIFNSKEILLNEVKGHKVVKGILDELIIELLNNNNLNDCKTFSQKLYQLISDNYRLIYENSVKELSLNANKELNLKDKIYYKLLLIADFVCGMTDSYAYEFYQNLQSIE